MPSQKDHVTSKYLVLRVTADESDDTFTIPAGGVEFYFSKKKLDAADGWEVPFAGGTASASACEVELGSVIPPPSVIRLVPTFQA